MEAQYSRVQKEEALEALRKQLETGSVAPGEIRELSNRLNIPIPALYVWKSDLKKKIINNGILYPESFRFSP